jgi:hypothetical protein
MFLDGMSFFDDANVQFIINVINEFSVINIDYLACNTLQSITWRDYYGKIAQQTSVIIGASNDKTGNISINSDSNWIMESTFQDIELIYFTKNIEYYTYVLDGNPVILKSFRVDYYQVNIYVLITMDVNNLLATINPGKYGMYSHPAIYNIEPKYTGPPSWLYNFDVYYFGTKYTKADLSGLYFEFTSMYPFIDNIIYKTNYTGNPVPNIPRGTPNPGITFNISNVVNSAGYDGLTYPNPSYDLVAWTYTIAYDYPCFKEDTKICTVAGYVSIQDLKAGDLVKTLCHGYLPIIQVGKKEIYNANSTERIKDQLYQYPPIDTFDPLIITGCHSVLVHNINEYSDKIFKLLGDIYITDNMYRLPACIDETASVYPHAGTYFIYHIALKNDNRYTNYGIYANGRLTETCSLRYLTEFSNMELS